MRVVRSVHFALVLSLGLGLVAPAAHVAAQPSPEAQSSQPAAAPDAPDSDARLEQRLGAMVQRLSLDARQTASVRQILFETRDRMRALRAQAPSGPDPAMHEARRNLMWSAEDRIWALLSCDQRDAFRLFLREQRAEWMDQHHGRGPGARRGPGRGRGHHRW